MISSSEDKKGLKNFGMTHSSSTKSILSLKPSTQISYEGERKKTFPKLELEHESFVWVCFIETEGTLACHTRL